MSWIQDIANPKARQWEEFYRNRWQHDRVVRSTHGVNCTGGCSWMVYVKDGIVTWEMQATDYPSLEAGLPPYEPRGCQRGISFSWYLYSPIRVKYPYLRGALMDLWREARSQHADPVDAWASIVEDEAQPPVLPTGAGQGRISPLHLGRGAGDHRRLDRLYGQEVRARPGRRLFAHPGHVHAQLCGRQPLSATAGRCLPQLLRLVQRPAARLARGLGRADRRGRERRLVQRQVYRVGGLQHEHDPHARRPLCRRGAPRRHQAGRLFARFQPGGQVRRLVGSDPRRAGRRLLDGGEPRHPERVPPRAGSSPTSWIM